MADGDGTEGGDGFVPITSQAEFDKRISARLNEVKRNVTASFAEAVDKAAKFDALEASSKSETEKLQQTIADLTARVTKSETEALRAEVAVAKGLTPGQARRLSGTTREELESDADELLADLGVKPGDKGDGNDGAGDGADGSGSGSTSGGAPPSRKPAADLRGGGDPTGAAEKDYTAAELAAMVPRQ